MAIVVEHDKRRKKILENALELFIEEGYEDVTFQKIADRCGITRTTLYIYFQNKREIFTGSIKQLGDTLEDALSATISTSGLSASARLRKVLMDVFNCCLDHRQLFSVLLTYLLQIQRMGQDPTSKVRRRIIKLRHLMSSILIEGINSGEFKKVDVKAANEVFYGLLESAIFRLSIMNQDDVPEFERMVNLSVDGICAAK
ncbi:MAG: TetR/AcrR family transcriptional regulator [Treponemataceae bacterium]|nr:TetR/AcrR family transcriptional regulator [Treponemataceae bacterium]